MNRVFFFFIQSPSQSSIYIFNFLVLVRNLPRVFFHKTLAVVHIGFCSTNEHIYDRYASEIRKARISNLKITRYLSCFLRGNLSRCFDDLN